ncbi:MAG TPA: PAS domain S-box protein [Terriglobales bacterium]|nr:PAS domain S-box protein [Terriglobales bacterium]
MQIKGPAKVLGLYLLFSASWIICTDILLEQIVVSSVTWHTAKGLVFVTSSGAILFWLCRRLVIEAHRMERALTEIFQQTAFGVYFADEHGTVLDCNEAFARLLGYSSDSLIGMNLRTLIHADQQDAAVNEWRKLFSDAADTSYVRQRKYAGKSGRAIWVRVAVSRIGADDKTKFVVALVQDVSTEVQSYEELKRQRKELQVMLAAVQQSEARFRRLLESSVTGIAVMDKAGLIHDCNDVFLVITGRTREELNGKKLCWPHLTVPDFRDDDEATLKQLQRSGRFTPFKTEILQANGTRIPVLVSGCYLGGGKEGRVDIVISVVDLQDAQRTEARLSRLERAVEHAYESIVITDLEANIVYVNPAFERLTGYSKAEILGNNPRLFRSSRTTQEEHAHLWETIKSGKVWKGRLWNRRRDKSEYLEDVTISPVRDSNGEVINYLAVKRDITREHVLEHRLMQAEKLEAMGQLAGGVAHDLNNVLQVVHSSAELAMRHTSDPTYTDRKLTNILTASARGAGIISQLLMFARRQTVSSEVLDLNQVISDTATMLRRLLPEDVELTLDLSTDLLPIEADAVRVSQVLMNLAINARDAMPNGGMLSIASMNCLDGSTGQHWVRLLVNDTGTGIKPEVRDKIFEPFFTTKQSGKGTGLGLATVKEIVQQCRGAIEVNSIEGRGTQFQIDFPAAADTNQEENVTAEQAPEELQIEGPVFVCEDDESVRTAMCDYLEVFGVQAVRFANADEVLKEARRTRPAVLISDVVMPGMSGLQLARELRKIHGDVRVLLVSGHTEHETLNEIAVGSEAVLLPKPFTGASLLKHLRELRTQSLQ